MALGKLSTFLSTWFIICKMEKTTVLTSGDYKKEHYKVPSTEHGTRETLNKQ